jgi:hypothetical protein
MFGQLRRASHVNASRLGATDFVAGASVDQLALEFCDAADDREH